MKIKCIKNHALSNINNSCFSIGDEFKVITDYDNEWLFKCKHGQLIEISKEYFELVKEIKGMDFHTKYSIGDKVFTLKRMHGFYNTPCVQCEGTGRYLTSYNIVTACPACHGSKVLTVNYTGDYSVNKETVTITKIHTEMYESTNGVTNSINYSILALDGHDDLKREEDLFLSEQEALDECNRRNKK